LKKAASKLFKSFPKRAANRKKKPFPRLGGADVGKVLDAVGSRQECGKMGSIWHFSELAQDPVQQKFFQDHRIDLIFSEKSQKLEKII
jgi:hypothetical protein